MIDIDAARRLATEWVRRADPEGRAGVYEFDLGYVAWRRGGPAVPNREYGTPCAVINRDTGELTLWPSLAAPRVAELYRMRAETERRFPAEVRALLRLGGWRPGRDVSAMVRAWWAGTGSTTPLPAGAAAVLNEFGGLRMRMLGWTFVPQRRDEPARFRATPVGRAGGPDIDPARTDVVPADAAALIVADLGGLPLSVDERGRVRLGGPDEVGRAAEHFDRLLVALLGDGNDR